MSSGKRADSCEEGSPALRPKDAATLILVRRDGGAPRVLMGQRSSRHVFLPRKYVFPGGRVDPQDGRVQSVSELDPLCESRLRHQARRRPRAFALTAIRETFEETGLVVGRSAETDGKSPAGWADYFALGAAPSLEGLTFIGRAITPPQRPRRFDARFFMALAEDVLIDNRPAMDGAELSDIKWVTLEDALSLDLPTVTRFMLGEIGTRLESPDKAVEPPFMRLTRRGYVRDRIGP